MPPGASDCNTALASGDKLGPLHLNSFKDPFTTALNVNSNTGNLTSKSKPGISAPTPPIDPN